MLDTDTLDAAIGQEAQPAAPKPPPQVLGVAGIAEQPIVIHDAKINWAMVAALPPFQMFLAEREQRAEPDGQELAGVGYWCSYALGCCCERPGAVR